MEWVKRNGKMVSRKPVAPGVYAVQGNLNLWALRGRVTDPKTGKEREICPLVEGSLAQAASELERLKRAILEPVAAKPRQRLSEYAASLFERKVGKGDLSSPASRL